MPRMLELTGQKFGKWTVLEKTNKRAKNGKVIWKCQCECGNIGFIDGTSLKSGNSKSCGKGSCHTGKPKGKGMVDLTNQRFDLLTVIKSTGRSDPKNGVIWECKCDCGNVCYKTTSSLHKSKINSCGCVQQSKGAYDIENLLKENNIKFFKEYSFSNCKHIHMLPFDFYLPDYNVLIEFDGQQHFINKPHFEPLKLIREKDLIKTHYCLDNNYILIRIPFCYKELHIEDLLPNSNYTITKDNIDKYYRNYSDDIN